MDVKNIEIFGDNFPLLSTIVDASHPVGSSYVQYPGFKDPNELWGQYGTEWENVSNLFPGLSIRFEGGLAEQFNRHIGADYGTPFTWNGNKLTINSVGLGIAIGTLLVDDNNDESGVEREARHITAVAESSGITTITLESVFTTQPDNLFVVQSDTLQTHTHGYNYTDGRDDGGSEGGRYWRYGPDQYWTYGIIGRTSEETRGKNVTVKLWKRIS